MENWLLIIVGLVFIVCIVVGFIRGFFKLGLSLLSTILTIVLMIVLNPYVSDALIKHTPLDNMIGEKCIEVFMPDIEADGLAGADFTGTPLEGLSEKDIKELSSLDMERMGVSKEDIMNAFGEIPKEVQIAQIEKLKLPSFLKNSLLENNNSAIYKELGVDSFPKYVASFISRIVINVLSFLVTFLLVIIIVKALMAAVDILGELPGIGLLNHFGGALLGAAGALLLVWIGFLVITLLYAMPAGEASFDMIDKSQVLTVLYNNNILLRLLLKF